MWPALELGEEPPGLLLAVNREYADRDRPLADGDEVALIPPVSGGAFRLSAEPLSLDDVVAEVASPDAGAIATFVGTTRRHSRGREVVRLEYEAFEGMAEAEMERIAAALRERHEILAVAIHHRVGVVGIGEASVVIAVSAAAPRGRARGLPRGDRHAQGDGAALEEGGLRGRRGVDREGLVAEAGPRIRHVLGEGDRAGGRQPENHRYTTPQRRAAWSLRCSAAVRPGCPQLDLPARRRRIGSHPAAHHPSERSRA